MKKKIILSFLVGMLSACSYYEKKVESIVSPNCEISTVKISIDEAYYDSVASRISDTTFLILDEDDKTMFSCIDKIMAYRDKFYVLDKNESRTVVSFEKDGSPGHRYGRVGQGPGEYVFPWDMDVDETGVYVLDTNSKKVIHYSEEGTFLGERSLPFFADALKRLKNGNFIFNITPDGKQLPALVVTDSLMNPVGRSNSYPEGYIGGCSTGYIFRKNGSEVAFYRSPSDTLIMLDESGKTDAFVVFDFLGKAIPEEAKTNYLAFRGSGVTKDYLRLVNNPIAVSDSIWVGLVEDGEDQYTILFNPLKNQCGGRKFTDASSVYDMIEPIFSDGKGTLFSLISWELKDRCRDYESLPDTIKNALDNGNRVLLIHKFPV